MAQNWNTFGELLKKTGEMPIVEESDKDAFWGAKPTDEQTLIGVNALGSLLMEVRDEYNNSLLISKYIVKPVEIEKFYLLGQPIEVLYMRFDSKFIVSKQDKSKEKTNKPK